MEIEELRKIAREHGYFLAKIPEKKIKILPCPCGRKQIGVWTRYDYVEKDRIGTKTKGYLLKCPNCGRTSEWRTSENEARAEWNRMVSK